MKSVGVSNVRTHSSSSMMTVSEVGRATTRRGVTCLGVCVLLLSGAGGGVVDPSIARLDEVLVLFGNMHV